MTDGDPANRHTRVLVLAPTARDAQVTRALLERAGLACATCAGVRALAREVAAGAGAAVVTEEAVAADGIEDLLDVLGRQPAWSELPVVMLMRGGVQSPAATRVLEALGNVTLLERPTSMRSVVSAAQAAVRSRRRQYQIRDQLAQIRAAEREREQLLDGERAARVEAERANRLKDEFLATVSHELRTPLNAILGWSQILRRRPNDPAAVADGLEVVERNARLQAQLIEDLLDMSRIDSGKIRIDTQPVGLGPVIDAAVASVRPAAVPRRIRVQTNLALVDRVSGDPGRLQQVLWNLLSNAVKFTPPGGRVTVGLRQAGPDVVLTVADTGQGIDPAFLPHLFERFRQADSSTTRKHGGLGLGLAIVKQLVELHGGRVEAHSDGEGRGATFVVTLPALRPADGPGPDTGPADAAAARRAHCGGTELAGVRVLVVDDDPDARELARRLLAECRAEVTTAASAAEALRLFAAAAPDVLLSDVGMPEMDGYEFIRRVRADVPGGADLPAAALTAFARPEDRRRALTAGYHSHLAKPLRQAELVALVATLAGRPVAATAAAATATAPGGRRVS